MNSNRKCKLLTLRSVCGNERGFILAVSLIFLGLLAAFGSAAVLATRTDIKIGGNYKLSTQAFYIAEAGLQAALNDLDDYNSNWNNGKYFQDVSLPSPTYTAASFSGGNYTVGLIDKTPPFSNKVIEVTSTGTTPNGATRVVQALFVQGSEPPTIAVINNGQLTIPISGNLSIMGTCGGIHANGPLQLNGSIAAEMQDGLTASETIGISGSNTCVGSDLCETPNDAPDEAVLDTDDEKTAYIDTNSDKQKVPVPIINPALFANEVASLQQVGKGFILHDDGTATHGGTCGADGLCSGGTTLGEPPQGWSFVSGQWKIGGGVSTAADGVFYVETSVKIQGSPGTDSQPWEATIIARDSIEWSSNAIIKPFGTTNVELKGITLVTGNDLKISGSAGIAGEGGAILVHQQFKMSGSSEVDGFIVVGDGKPTWAGDPFATSTSGDDLSSTNSMSGNPKITYDCQQVECDNAACGVPKVKISAGTWTEPSMLP